MLITLQQLKSALQAVKSYITSVVPTKTSDLTNDSGFINDVSSIDLTDRIIKGTDTQGNDVEGAVVEGLLRNYSFMGMSFTKNVSSGLGSHAEGGGTQATSIGAHAEGGGTQATNIGSHSEGAFTISSSMGAHAEGEYSSATGEASHSEGFTTTASNTASHSEGLQTKASGYGSHAEGNQTLSNGISSHTEGSVNCSLGDSCHVEGKNNVAYSSFSHAEGIGEIVSVYLTTVDQSINKYKADSETDLQIGYIIYNNDKTVFAKITNIEKSGNDIYIILSSAISSDSISGIQFYLYTSGAIGMASHSEGYRTIAASNYQHVQGKFNISDSNNTYAHIVGGGTNMNARANIHTIDWSGNGWYSGKLTVGTAPTNNMDVATKKYVDDNVPTVPTNVSAFNNDSGFITGMTILSYGSSTWNDFITAYNSNKVVYCRASSNSDPASGSQTRLAFMAYVDNATTPTNVEFQYYRSVSSHSASQQGDQVYVYTLKSTGVWSVTVREAMSKIAAGTNMSSSYSNGTLTLNCNGTVVTNVSGASPVITAEADTRYICGEVTSLSFTPCASGICDVRFTSGSTVTVLTLPNTVKMPDWFDASVLEANTIYEINILDGVYGVVTTWAV